MITIKPLLIPINNIINLINDINTKAQDLFLVNDIISNNTTIIIYNFLKEYKESSETIKLYAKELERLMLWCYHNLNKEILNIHREDIVNYQYFLEKPEPKAIWCGNKVPKLLKTGVINEAWRVFHQPLSNASIKKSMRIIDSFFNYLVQSRCLEGNPLAINRRRQKKNPGSKLVDRYLELDEINIILNALTKYQNETTKKFLAVRAKYIVLLLFYTGMRIAEASNHTMGNFIQREDNWFLAIIGKGKKYRSIPIPDELLDALSEFRVNIGLPHLPEFKEATPLIPNIGLKYHLTTRRIDQILKWAFTLGAQLIEIEHPRKSSKLKQASAHWLRHSYVTYLLNSGAPLKVAQENAGHSDIGTTMLYRHVNQADRHQATRNLSLKAEKKINN